MIPRFHRAVCKSRERPRRPLAVKLGPPYQRPNVSFRQLRTCPRFRRRRTWRRIGWFCAAMPESCSRRDCYSITSSARAESPGGTSRPSVLAALRLIKNSNRVAWSTGRSDAPRGEEREPEKAGTGFGKGHTQTQWDDDSKRSHPALAPTRSPPPRCAVSSCAPPRRDSPAPRLRRSARCRAGRR
jgi:hypothetical protein